MPVSGDEFRAALARWASGVAIVTAAAGDRVHGMTVSAFASVSLSPPLVLVCADKTSITLELVETGGVFAVNVLAADQQALWPASCASTVFSISPTIPSRRPAGATSTLR